MLRQRGFLLIEWMLAGLITAIILSGAVATFVALKRSYLFFNQFAYVQDNARFAVAMLTRSLREAGYAGGCHTAVAQLTQTYQPSSSLVGLVSLLPVTGYAAQHTFPPALEKHRWQPHGSEALVLRHVANPSFVLLSAVGERLQTVPAYTLKPSAILLLSRRDCATMALLRLPSSQQLPLSVGDYQRGDRLFPLTVHAFFLKPASFDPSLPTLAVQLLHAEGGMELADLVPGVDDLQFTYGLDITPLMANGQVNRYVKADTITHEHASAANAWVGWDRVVSVQVDLVLRSLYPVRDSAEPVILLGKIYTDLYLRQLVSFTVYLRNGVWAERRV